MKIIIKSGENRDGYTMEEMLIDGANVISVYPLCECPEDAVIGRGLTSCYDILELMRSAWEAGIKKENFEVKEEPLD